MSQRPRRRAQAALGSAGRRTRARTLRPAAGIWVVGIEPQEIRPESPRCDDDPTAVKITSSPLSPRQRQSRRIRVSRTNSDARITRIYKTVVVLAATNHGDPETAQTPETPGVHSEQVGVKMIGVGSPRGKGCRCTPREKQRFGGGFCSPDRERLGQRIDLALTSGSVGGEDLRADPQIPDHKHPEHARPHGKQPDWERNHAR